MTTSLALFGNKVLRSAIERNQVSFPAQVPVFAKHEAGEIQARIVQLYFVAGWTIRQIGQRYRMTGETVRKSLTEWRVRAISSGYLQEIGSDVFPELAGRAPEESEDQTPEAIPALKVVPIPAPSQPRAVQERKPAVLHLLLEEIDSPEPCPWEPFRVRLLEMLRHECLECGLTLSAAQVERIQASLTAEPSRTGDLLRDLRYRIADEEPAVALLSQPRPGRLGLMHRLIDEIQLTVEEQVPASTGAAVPWPPHCISFLGLLEEGCMDLGLEFSLAQVRRIERAFTAGPERLGDLVRDLRNRVADEAGAPGVARHAPCQLTAGSNR